MTQELSTVLELREQVSAWRRSGETLALVPTMGALHNGHISLVTHAQKLARRVIVSIFVNPTQFAPHEDLSKYPRPLAADVTRLKAAGVDAVFNPHVAEMYGSGFCTTVSLGGPAKVGLEDAFRPTHFSGVATVVTKLLVQGQPDFALFGEKDYQQLAVVRQMVQDLDIPVQIVGGPTLREPDGLAMSSRNVFLNHADRKIAPEIFKVMNWCKAEFKLSPIEAVLASGRAKLEAVGFKPDYLELRDARSLARVETLEAPARLLFAGTLGNTRLIDNIAV